MNATVWRGARIVPMDGPEDAPCGAIRAADVRVEGDRIAAVGAGLEPRPGDVVRDVAGLTILPGFVQGHVHFCQTLFRGLADDRPLLAWLRERIWPLEAAHDAGSVRVSAEVTAAELLRGGTTTVQAIETVHHTEQTFEVARDAGLCATVGNCLMDVPGDGVPDVLAPSAAENLAISEELCRAFHGQQSLRYAVSPRFVLSCTDGLARDAAAFAEENGLRVHTHASEHPEEVAAVRRAFGREYLDVLHAQGLLGERTGLAHCVHLSDPEVERLVGSGATVLHCPSANLKLGSGIARIAAFDARGVGIALGADGAPCNNRLSALTELRQAALMQALGSGPGAWPAERALFAATRGGARALGLEDVGAIRPGMRADLVLLDLRGAELGAGDDPVAQVVWTASEAHVRHVVVGGRDAVVDGRMVDVDVAALAERARTALGAVLARSGLAR